MFTKTPSCISPSRGGENCYMSYTVKVEQFEGPFDLLLQLIEQNKLDITQLSLSFITEQYIQMIQATSEKISPNELADFLVIAAKLLLIKSKTLMPYLSWGEEDDSIDLEKQLRMYKEYFEASKCIQKMINKKNFLFFREKFLVPGDIGFQPPRGITQKKLADVFRAIVDALMPLSYLPKSIIRRTINIQEKISRIRNIILNQANVHFSHILREAKDKTEVIVSFLAILELMKQREVTVKQDTMFEEIIIEKFLNT